MLITLACSDTTMSNDATPLGLISDFGIGIPVPGSNYRAASSSSPPLMSSQKTTVKQHLKHSSPPTQSAFHTGFSFFSSIDAKDRKSVVKVKSVSGSLEFGDRRNVK